MSGARARLTAKRGTASPCAGFVGAGFVGAAFLCAAWLVPAANAADYPNKPIHLLIASAPGGGTDAIGRVLAEALSASLKVPVVPENRAGASGQIATEQLARAAPDGYTLEIVQNAHATNPAFVRKLPYDTLKDFAPIAPLATSPLVLVASSASGVRNWSELVALGRRDPDTLSFASSESSARMAVEQLGEASGLKVISASYKGTGPAMTDVVGGHTNYSVTTIASALPFKGSGKINFLAVLSKERSAFLPDVPTLAEQGVPDIEVRGWWAILGPAALPPAIVDQLNAAIRAALALPEVRAKLQTLSVTPWSGSPQELDRFVRSEIPKLQQLAKSAGIEAE